MTRPGKTRPGKPRFGQTRFGRRKLIGYGVAACGSSFFLKACSPDLSALDKSLGGGATGNSESSDAAAVATADTSEAEQSVDIKVGLLHSLSGPLAMSEAPLVDAERLAIEEINAAGGLLGKQLVPVVADGASDWPTFAEKTEKLITENNVAIIFGGFTTASRKAMLPVVMAKNRLLWYPGPYEGEECEQNIFYAGAIANQQIEPALNWMLGNRGKSFFLVSNNERTAHDIAKAVIKEKGGKVAGEAFVPLRKGTKADMMPVVDDIQKALPEGGIIFNALLGTQNQAFFKELKSAGLSAFEYIVMSVRLSEPEIAQIGKSFLLGHYAAWPYFQTLETPENKAWVNAFQSRYGPDSVIGSPTETAYTMVHLWAQAVKAAESVDTTAVRAATYGQTFAAPGGTVAVAPNHHVSQRARIGRVRGDGLFDIEWSSSGAIAPTPWNPRIATNKNVTCDWSHPDKGKRYQPTLELKPVITPPNA
ncbi:MAG: urea ABC transporter substrate-binding protein [Cyanobacteria bacterium J06621_3]